jgi:hypothetical protein
MEQAVINVSAGTQLISNVTSHTSNITSYSIRCGNMVPHTSNGLDLRMVSKPFSYAIPLYGYLIPVLAMLLVPSSVLIVAVFYKMSKLKSPTHVLFTTIAVTNALTVVLPAPVMFYFYGLGHCYDYVEFSWCSPFFYLVKVLPEVTQMAFIWLVLILGSQRYTCVVYPLWARRHIRIRHTYIAIAVIWSFSICLHIYTFVQFDFQQVTVHSLIDNTTLISSCDMGKSARFSEKSEIYYSGYKSVLSSFLPYCGLVVLDMLMLMGLVKANRRRQRLADRPNESNPGGTNLLFRVTIVIITVICILEIPGAVIAEIEYFTKRPLLPLYVAGPLEVLHLTSYPVILVTYCLMGKAFRQTLVAMLTPGTPARGTRIVTRSADPTIESSL